MDWRLPLALEKALENIFTLKSRPLLDPLIVHVGNLKQAREVTKYWPPLADSLAKEFWPGPLTLVMEKAKEILPLITAGLNTLALRMPKHPLTLELIRQMNTPLAAPSANRFGHMSPTRIKHVERDLIPEMKKQKYSKPIKALNGGPCTLGLESTVLQIQVEFLKKEGQGKLKSMEIKSYSLEILRPGPITQEEIQTLLKKKGFQAQWKKKERKEKNSHRDLPFRSPGQGDSHYAPYIPFVLCKEVPQNRHKKEWATHFQLSSSLCWPVELTLSEDPVEAARELYSKMRFLEENASEGDVLFFIFQPKIHRGEKWQAVLDRIQKAAHLHI